VWRDSLNRYTFPRNVAIQQIAPRHQL